MEYVPPMRHFLLYLICIYGGVVVYLFLEPFNTNSSERPKSNLLRRSEQKSNFHTVVEGVLYAYSAYFDSRQPDKHRFGAVRVFGLYNKQEMSPHSVIHCSLHYLRTDGTKITLVSPGHLTDLEIYSTCIWNTGEVLCENVVPYKAPHSVTVQIRGTTETDNTIPVTNINAQRKPGWKKHMNDDMAVCMSTVFSLKNIDKGYLLQSLDMKFAMGVDKMFIYGSYDNSPGVQELLSKLAGPSVQVLDFILPEVIEPGIFLNAKGDMNHCARYNAQPLQYLDCHYRNMYKYRYLAVIDLDEFIYPMATSMDTVALLDKISERGNNQVASFMFFHYQSCYGNEMTNGFQVRRWAHRATLRTDVWVPYSFKCVHRPELVTHIRIHRYKDLLNGTNSVIVSPIEANLYHFHRKCSPTEIASSPMKFLTPESRQRDDVIDLYVNRTIKHLALKRRRLGK